MSVSRYRLTRRDGVPRRKRRIERVRERREGRERPGLQERRSTSCDDCRLSSDPVQPWFPGSRPRCHGIIQTGKPNFLASRKTPPTCSPCSCVTTIPARSEGASKRLTVSRKPKPQSSIKQVAPCSTSSALPALPLPSEAKGITATAGGAGRESSSQFPTCRYRLHSRAPERRSFRLHH